MAIPNKNNLSQKVLNSIPQILDPTMLRAAREIYETYCKFHITLDSQPIGVAIDKKTYNGQLIFKKQPILLPWESFIPISLIISERK
ncbi:hypothetical protein IQ215_00180 [Cyanobacterium stanieri LEGE 03274]|uniref:Uncharacterized protein n=1 Tax=Cyanobacterium stanieri LEGE 03274 TaxID=1828756 RepID=A0ABR9V2Q4_9CHRO|nr:hypothetical protein [Cyanobacterium stanieri]MBE9221104.1 hypothetical protein [Cyanobacterium stanieri LEGE 03274]